MPEQFIQPPRGGVSKRIGFQKQPPFTAVESVNFLPFDAVSGRRVSATRPPLTAFESPGTTVNLIQRVNFPVASLPQRSMITAVSGTVYYWDGVTWQAVSSGESVTTGRPVYATTFLSKIYIMNDTSPLVFDYSAQTLVAWTASEGTVPSDNRVAATWQGAVWLAGSASNPQQFFGSRIGDPDDWDFTQTDDGAAFTAVGEFEGLVGEPITALIPLSSDTMIIAGRETLAALRGHPNDGGILEQVSSAVGVLGQGAWCKTDDDQLFFMSKLGLMTMNSSGTAVAAVSRDKIPDDLVGLYHAFFNPEISMEYDTRWNGIHITVRPPQNLEVEEALIEAGGPVGGQAWFYDIEDGGFFQLDYAGLPTVMERFDPFVGEGTNGVLYCGDSFGGIAQWDTNGSESMTARQIIGPIAAGATSFGRANLVAAQHLLLDGTTASANSRLAIRGGHSGNDVVRRYNNGNRTSYFATDTTAAIANGGRSNPQVSGNAFLIELSHVGENERIVYEGTSIRALPAGISMGVPFSSEVLADSVTVVDTINGGTWTYDPGDGTITSPGGTVQPYFPDPDNGPVFRNDPITGAPIIIDEDDDEWLLYVSATPDNPGEELTAFSLWIDMSRFPIGWWDVVRSDGGDVRATTSDNNMVPFALVDFNKADRTGFLVARFTVPTTAPEVRVWAGNPNATLPEPNSLIGQFSAFDGEVIAFYPDGASLDLTRNAQNLSRELGMVHQQDNSKDIGYPQIGTGVSTLSLRTAAYRDRKSENQGDTRFTAKKDSNNDYVNLRSDVSNYTVYGLVRTGNFINDSSPSIDKYVPLIGVYGPDLPGAASAIGRGYVLGIRPFASGTDPDLVVGLTDLFLANLASSAATEFELTSFNSTDLPKIHQTKLTAATYEHYALRFVDNSDINIWLNGVKDNDTITDQTENPFSQGELVAICLCNAQTPGSSTFFPRQQDLDLAAVQIDKTNRSDNWISYHASMRTQSSFWNNTTWSLTEV